MDQNESNVGPVHSIKSLHQIQFEDKSASILGFHSVESLLGYANRFNNLAIFEKTILFLENVGVQERLKPNSNNLRNQFVHHITQ